MHLNVPPDLEKLINKRLSSGAFADAEDVVRHALQAQDAEEGLTGEERDAIATISTKATSRPNVANS